MTDAEFVSILILKWYPYLYLKTIFKMCKNSTKNIKYQSSPQQKPNYSKMCIRDSYYITGTVSYSW